MMAPNISDSMNVRANEISILPAAHMMKPTAKQEMMVPAKAKVQMAPMFRKNLHQQKTFTSGKPGAAGCVSHSKESSAITIRSMCYPHNMLLEKRSE